MRVGVAVRDGREPRTSGRLATHILEVVLGLEAAAQQGRTIEIRSAVERPPLLEEAAA